MGKSLLFSWLGRIGEVNLSGATIQRPAHEFRYDIMDITVRGKRMACVRWEFDIVSGHWNFTGPENAL